MNSFEGLWFDCEEKDTYTSHEQCACEKQCAQFLKPFDEFNQQTLERFRLNELLNESNEIRLLRRNHVEYLTNGLTYLSAGFVSLDASRPWIIYWILQALYLLDAEPVDLYPRVITTLASMQNSSGGFGGGPMQLSHAAPNYAAVLALCIIGTDEALSLIDRPAMYNYFLNMKNSHGQGFRMHTDGETDTRGTYTILAVAKILNILTPELMEGLGSYLVSCQTFEGGFGGEPYNEAHGGYNMCALAALIILGKANDCDLDAQERWLTARQCRLEGGFQGRTNKLVDSCYSFWQTAAFVLVDLARSPAATSAAAETSVDLCQVELQSLRASTIGQVVAEKGGRDVVDADQDVEIAPAVISATKVGGALSCNQFALQRYLLHCAQQLDGGLRDKPGKSRDFYHTCYALSGMALAQHRTEPGAPPQVYGDVDNVIRSTSALFNIGPEKVARALEYYRAMPCSHKELTTAYELR